jgi:ABC-2 type transport system ATP-binding protein
MRCEIAAALLHRPKILFLDEPTIGLDVTAKALLREHLKHLAEAEDTVILLTSHDTGDIEEICGRVILINHGRILLDKPLEDLRSAFLTTKQITLVTEEETPVWQGTDGVTVVERGRHRLTLSVDVAGHAVEKVVAQALESLTVRDLTIENAPLDDVIRDLYGEKT